MWAIFNKKRKIEESCDVFKHKIDAIHWCKYVNESEHFKHKPYQVAEIRIFPVGGWKSLKK